MKESAIKFSKDSTADGKHIFLIVRYFEKNDLGIAEAKIRLFLFKLTSDVMKLTVGKSQFHRVKLDMNFAADQYIFNAKVYAKVRETFNEYLVKAGKKTIESYSSVDVET